MHELSSFVSLLEKENMEFLSSDGKFAKQPSAASVYVLHTETQSTNLKDRIFVPSNYELSDKEKGKIRGSSKGFYICQDRHAKENPLHFIVRHKVDLTKNRAQALKEACKVKEYFKAFEANRAGLNIDYVLVLDFQDKAIDEKAVLAELHAALQDQGSVKFRLLSHNGKESILSQVYSVQNARAAFAQKQPAITAFAQRIDPFANLAREAARASQSANNSSQSSVQLPKKPVQKKKTAKNSKPLASMRTLDNFFVNASVHTRQLLPPVALINTSVHTRQLLPPVASIEVLGGTAESMLTPRSDDVVPHSAELSAPLEVMVQQNSQDLFGSSVLDDKQPVITLVSHTPELPAENDKKEKRSVEVSAQTDWSPRRVPDAKKARFDDDVSDLTEPEDEYVELDEAFFDCFEAYDEVIKNSREYISENHIYMAFVNNSLVSKRIASRREFLPSELQRLETFFRDELSQFRSLANQVSKFKPHVEVNRLKRNIDAQIVSVTQSLEKLSKIQSKYLFGQSVAPFVHKYLASNDQEILSAFQQCLPNISPDSLAKWYRKNNFAVLSSIADCCYQNRVVVLSPSAKHHIASIARFLAFYLIMIHPKGKSLISTAKESVEIPSAVLELIQTYIGVKLDAIDKGPVLDSLVNAYTDLSQQELPSCRSNALKKHLSTLHGLQHQSNLLPMHAS